MSINCLPLCLQLVETQGAAHQMNGQSSELKTVDIVLQVANNQGV